MFDVQTYLAAKSGKLLASPDMDMFSYLLGKSQASPTKTITGVPPFTFKSNGDNLIDWSIKGNTGGVGERTKNLVDITDYDATFYRVRWYEDNGQLKASGTYNDNSAHTQPRFYTELSAGTYTLSGSPDYEQSGVALQVGTCSDATGSNYTSLGYDRGSGFTFTLQTGSWVSVRVYTASSLYQQSVDLTLPFMLRPADTTSKFIPYGYEIPVTCGGTTTDIFIGDSPLGADDTVSKTSTGVDIPTVNGSNTLTVDTTVQPSEMSITYHR